MLKEYPEVYNNPSEDRKLLLSYENLLLIFQMESEI